VWEFDEPYPASSRIATKKSNIAIYMTTQGEATTDSWSDYALPVDRHRIPPALVKDRFPTKIRIHTSLFFQSSL
jgi:hypothetical protein